MVPLPVAPETGWTMSTPWSRKVLASCSPLAGSFHGLSPPTNVPVSLPSPPRRETGVPLLLFVGADAGVHAVQEPGHAGELRPAVGPDLAGLAEARGEVAGEHGGLVDLEVEAGEGRRGRGVGGAG